MQEEIEERSVRLAVTGTKLTARALVNAIRMYLRHRANKKLNSIDEHIIGKQKIDDLIKQNQGVSSMVVGDKGIRQFEKIAKKYGVDFAIVKDKSKETPVYTAFFKARDTDALEAVMNDYGAKMMKIKERPSVRAKLQQFIEKAKAKPKKIKTKKMEQVR